MWGPWFLLQDLGIPGLGWGWGLELLCREGAWSRDVVVGPAWWSGEFSQTHRCLAAACGDF